MNNQQFRRLLLSDNGRQGGSDKDKPAAAAAASSKSVLGARKHSSIPMTPRQAGRGSVQADFARQLAERNAKANKTKGIAPRTTTPKGTKLAAGYVDRTKLRVDADDSEMAKRIKNLEESMKAGEIDRDTFERTVQDITGGHLSTTHLVRGLDRKLLERVRRGEDVTNEGTVDKATEDAQEGIEDAFDELASQEVEAIVHDKEEKKGQKVISTPPAVAGVKRTRNDILKDLRRQRDEAIAAAVEHEKKHPSLGPGFRKVGGQGETSRIETDDKGREVLIITGPDGKEKRKVRKQKPQQPSHTEIRHETDDVSTSTSLHNLASTTQNDSADDDIFEGVGSNYNPLAHFDDAEDDSDSSDEDPQSTHINDSASTTAQTFAREAPQQGTENINVEDDPFRAPAKRDYFKSVTRKTAEAGSGVSSADATVRAALTKVRNLDGDSNLLQNLSSNLPGHDETDDDRLKRRAAELAASDRDMEDMDLGFGASRFDDADDMEREGEKVKFSQWKGMGANDDDDDGASRDSKRQRKRGPKKKRGDKNKAEDVLRVMESQREKRTLG